MKRKPRRSNEPLLPRILMLWLGTAGLVMALGTLAVAWWGDDEHGTDLRPDDGVHDVRALQPVLLVHGRDERRSIFSLETFEDTQVHAGERAVGRSPSSSAPSSTSSSGSSTRPGCTLEQWLLCIGVALTIVAVSEVRKLILRRRPEPAAGRGRGARRGRRARRSERRLAP